MIGLSDEAERLVKEMRMDELKERIQDSNRREQPDQSKQGDSRDGNTADPIWRIQTPDGVSHSIP